MSDEFADANSTHHSSLITHHSILTISVIIPTRNEATTIGGLVSDLLCHGHGRVGEVIVVDSGSTDATIEEAQWAGARVVQAPRAGRAAQMNYAAQLAQGNVLYFVHADVMINPDYVSDIAWAIRDGYESGCYRFRFDSDKALLRFNSYGTRFKGLYSRGGDQTLFITRSLFERIGGFNEHYVIMEDFDIVRRILRVAKFLVIPKDVVVSARKYETNSWLRVQVANLTAVLLFRCRVHPSHIARTYKLMLNYR